MDTTPPQIQIEAEMLVVSVTDPQEALFVGITAQDNRDGDVTDSLLVESIHGINDDHVATVTYAAFDARGNVAKAQRQVQYSDYESPRFELDRSLIFSQGSGFDVLDYVGARDVLEGDIRRRVHATLISDTKSLDEMGTHQVKFQVTNSMGDTSEAIFAVEVVNPDWYTASVVLKEYLIYLDVGDRFNARSYLETFYVRGDPIDVRNSIPSDVTCDIVDLVNTNLPGIYEVTYTLSKNVNLSSFSGQSKLIVVVEE